MNLVTGGTGLVGAHLLLLLLEKGEKTRAIYKSKKSIEKTKSLFKLYQKEKLFSEIEWFEAEINDIPALEKAFEGIDYVYHCAAYVSLSSSDSKMYKINIVGTANIVNLSIDFGVKKLCYVSSIAALGEPEKNELTITEQSEWNANGDNSDYAISKYGGEIEVFRGYQEGLKIVIVNPGVILGPGFWTQGSNVFFDVVKNGMLFYTKGKTGFVAVNDVTKAMYQLMKSEIHSERFIVVAENLAFDTFITKVADSIQAKKPKFYANKTMTNLASLADYIFSKLFFRERTFTKSMSKSAHSESIIDNSKLKNTLNFEYTDLDQYINELGKMYLNYRKK